MLRITELRLPLDHPDDALRRAIVARLRIADADLVAFTVFRRGYDARKKSAIVLSYTLDCELRDEAAPEHRERGEIGIGDAQPRDDRGAQRFVRVVQRQSQFGDSQHRYRSGARAQLSRGQ